MAQTIASQQTALTMEMTAVYLRQTGSQQLTPRQRRRIKHKVNKFGRQLRERSKRSRRR